MPATLNALCAVGTPTAQAFFLKNDVASTFAALGTTQSTAAPLIAEVTIVTTAGASATGVRIPSSAYVGQAFLIRNATTRQLTLFPRTGGTIDGGAADAGVPIETGNILSLVVISAATSRTFVSIVKDPVALTFAATGTTQGAAALLPIGITLVTTASGAALAVQIPATVFVGQTLRVINTTAQALSLFPQPGNTINAEAANASVSIAAGATATIIIASATNARSY